MKITILTLIVSFTASFCMATEFRIRDGKVEFPIAKVAKELAYTQTEKDVLISKYDSSTTAITPVTVTPEKYETNLSTCVLSKFSSHSDFSSKEGLYKKLKELKAESDLLTDLGDAKAADYKQRYEWMKSYYATFP